jgi:hypothetical protein
LGEAGWFKDFEGGQFELIDQVGLLEHEGNVRLFLPVD